MAKGYSKLGKDDLLKVIEKLESRKKYGLIWDEEKTKEKFEKESENALPILKEVKGKEIKTDPAKPTNILIEGDNYHALSVLNYTHQGKIDVIYIDPPYNTGAKNWRYNNDFVEKDDAYRHSKWISFMYKRLVLAKKILKPNGVLICAIDENEHANLSLILSEIFPAHRIDSITVVHNPRGVQGKNFSFSHEYAVFVYPDDGEKYIADAQRAEALERNFRVDGSNSPRNTAKTCFYSIIVKDGKIVGFGDVAKKSFHPKQTVLLKDKSCEVWPIDIKGIERKWSYSRNTVEEIITQLRAKKRGDRYEITRIKEKAPYRTVWIGPKYDANEYGSKLVNGLVKTLFPFPKSLYTVKECLLATIIDNKEATVLDFFAGSGTTGHAVSLLNKEDEGKRKFIICTNNENEIAEKVCYPRIKAVIRGHKDYSDITGIKSNLKYFKTAFVKNSISRDDLKIRITHECTEMLCLREGIFDEKKKKNEYRVFAQDNRIMAVYYALEREGLTELKKELDKMKGDKILYCFTLDPLGLDKEDFADWNNVSLESIPQKILDIYEQIYEY